MGFRLLPLSVFAIAALSGARLIAQPTPKIPLPPIKSAGDAAFGQAATRTLSLAELGLELVKIDQVGSWSLNKRWEIIINSLQPAEIPPLLEIVAKMRSENVRAAFRNAFYSRWAEADPAGAITHADDLADPVLRDAALSSALQGWSYANPKELALWASQLPEGALKNAAALLAITAIAANEPSAIVGAVKVPDGGSPTDRSNLLSSIVAKDPMAAVAEVAKVPQPDRRLQEYLVVAQSWAGLSPDEAMQWAETLPGGSGRDQIIESILTTWGRSNPSRAVEHLVNLPSSPFSDRSLTQLLGMWARTDTAAAVAWARNRPDPAESRQMLARVAPFWLKQAPEEALAFGRTLAPGPQLNNFVIAVMDAFLSPDPDRILAFIRQLTPESRQSLIFGGVLNRLVGVDPPGLIGLIRESPPFVARANLLAEAIVKIAQHDRKSAETFLAGFRGASDEPQILRSLIRIAVESDVDWAKSLYPLVPPGEGQRDAASAIATALGHTNPQAALAWVKSLPAGMTSAEALVAAIREVATNDRQAAWREAVALPPSPTRMQLLSGLAIETARADPAEARGLLSSMSDPNLRPMLVRAVAEGMIQSDPAAAMELALSVPPETRASFLKQLGENWAQFDWAAATKWAAGQSDVAVRDSVYAAAAGFLSNSSLTDAARMTDQISGAETRALAAERVVAGWMRYDPMPAARWAESCPSGIVRAAAMSSAAATWARQDFSSAAQWLTQLPSDDVPDRAIESLLENSPPSAGAVAMTSRIKDPDMRLRVLEWVAGQWLRSDRDAARRWLAAADIPADMRRRLTMIADGNR